MGLFSEINWATVSVTILGSGVFAALLTSGVNWYLDNRSREDLKYEKLYGPLRFNLQMMKLIVENKEEVLEDIKEWKDVNTRIDLIQKHLSPLTIKWIEHKNNIRRLFENNPGLVKQKDLKNMSDFMDGCIKREITEDSKNVLAINQNRTDKLIEAVKSLQNNLL